MNDDDLRQAQSRGMQMRQIAESPGGLFEVMAQVRLAYLETIAASKASDTAGREALYHRIRAHDTIVAAMTDVIKAGANASAIVAALTKKSEKKASNVA